MFIFGSLVVVGLVILTVRIFLVTLLKLNKVTKFKGLYYFIINFTFLALLTIYFFVPLEIYKKFGVAQDVHTFYLPFLFGVIVSIFLFKNKIIEISKLKF